MLTFHTGRLDARHVCVAASIPSADSICTKTERHELCTRGGNLSTFSTFGMKRKYRRDDEIGKASAVKTPMAKNEPRTNYAYVWCSKVY